MEWASYLWIIWDDGSEYKSEEVDDKEEWDGQKGRLKDKNGYGDQ